MTSRPVYYRAAPPGAKAAPGRRNPFFLVAKGRVVAALSTCFNFLALNLALLVVSLPLVTVPLAFNAAMVALGRWREGGEDRMVREFFGALRSSPPLRTTLLLGAPLTMAALGVEEVHYFVLDRQGIARVCFGFGLAALLVTLGALGYVFLLAARHPSMPAAELWSLCVRLGIRNLFVTGPLFLIEIVVASLLTLADPPLLLLGVPAVFLYSMRLTAQFGLRRAANRKLV